MALDLYLDTSTIGGYFDEAFEKETRKLWKLQAKGIYRFYTSVIAIDEISRAPEQVKQLFAQTFNNENFILKDSEESERLAMAYLEQKIVSEKFFDDARHVAICTIRRIGHLVSWNFRHLANLNRESGFNAVNLLQGYPTIRILSPEPLIYGHE